MAEIVGGFLLPHDPLITAVPDAPSKEQKDAVLAAYETVSMRIRELNVDTVIVVGADHYAVFGPHCIPRALIVIGEADGPLEPWVGLPREAIKVNQKLAQHIMQYGFDNGVDWAIAKSITMDHSTVIPIRLSLQQLENVSAIPVFVNCGVEPVISSQRCYEIGQNIRDAVSSWEGSERVAIFGTGGMSHWPGMARMGDVNREWDHMVLETVGRGDVQKLISLVDAEVLEQSGNGALEIKNWITAMGFLGDCRGEIIEYQPINEWVTGLGFAELSAA